jgi:hypothetical protein
MTGDMRVSACGRAAIVWQRVAVSLRTARVRAYVGGKDHAVTLTHTREAAY